ncbi:hypothetical protein ACHAXT_011234 [Thalassiosira profunda]
MRRRLPPLYLSLWLVSIVAASAEECSDGSKEGECIGASRDGCIDATAFQQRVASVDDDPTIPPLLRGAVDDIISQEDIAKLLEWLPISEFVEASGYDESNNRDGRAYNAPVAYAGLGLRDLSTSNEARYEAILQIRERVRSATEQSLGLCPGALLVDFTTVSQKTEGGAHRAHADNCLHYFDETTNMATCDAAREHPYPKRVAASILYLNDHATGNFVEGEFYFANRMGGVVEAVPMEAGRMVYFTSGVENLHGALPVKRTDYGGDQSAVPRRLALAMWYVTDPELEEYVPPFQQTKPSDGSSRSKVKPRKVHDPNDPSAPKELFVVPIPKRIDTDALLESMGARLTNLQKSNLQWKALKGDEEGTLLMLFADHSALFSLDFGVALSEPTTYAEASVVVERHTDGRKPASLQYQLQESVVLHAVLDALLDLMLEGLDEKETSEVIGAVEKARDTLPARRA